MIQTYRLIGIDPGTNNIGFCCFIIDSTTLKLLRIETVNIDVSTSSNFKKDTILYDAKVPIRLNALDKSLEFLFLQYKPIACSCEDVYINKFRPAAVSPLAKAVRTIESCFRRVVNGYMKSVNPMTAKRRIRVIRPKKIKGVKVDQKQIVTDAINRSQLPKYSIKNISDMTEHEQDAMIITLELYNTFLVSTALRMKLLTDVKLGNFVKDYIYKPYLSNIKF